MNSEDSEEEDLIAEDFGWRDYIAVFIALAQTVLLPFIIAGLCLLLLLILSIYVV